MRPILRNVWPPATTTPTGGILKHGGTVEVVASEHRDRSPVERDLRWRVHVVFRAPSDCVKRCFGEYGLRTDASSKFAALYRPYHLIGLELGISAANRRSRAVTSSPTSRRTRVSSHTNFGARWRRRPKGDRTGARGCPAP
jgi:predicted homoserine dehydrogenase-like protein